MAAIELDKINKIFTAKDGGRFYAVKDASLTVNEGEIFGIIGFSGAGKSTLVRVINLLGRPDSGSVTVNGRNMLALTEKELREERKKIGMIFQHFNLMPSRNVFDNVAFPLKRSGLSKTQIAEKVRRLLSLVELSDKEDSFPSQLSGGQKQRVAIARALANEPKILLCDEATSALDPTTTNAILALIKKLNQELKITVVIITHQMNVIKDICDKVAVMDKGEILEQGEVYEVFASPQNQVTKNFIKSTSNLQKVEDFIKNNSSVTELKAGEKLVRLSYRARNISEPLISTVAREFNVSLNIIFADIEIVQGAPIGGTVAIVIGDEEDIEKALWYLADKNVGVEVLKGGSGLWNS